MSSQPIDHNLAVALDAIGFVGQMIVDEELQRFSFDRGVQALFPNLVQIAPGEATLTELDQRIHPRDLSLIHAVLRKPVNESRRLIIEYAVTDDAGQRHVLQSHSRAMELDDAGRANKLLSVLIDITALRPDRDGGVVGPGSERTEHVAGLVDDLMARASLAQTVSPDEAREDGPTVTAGAFLTMQEVAERLQLPFRTLRFFEDRGLVRPKHAGSERLFTRQQVHQLTFAARMRRIGFTLAEIRSMIEDSRDPAHPRIDPKAAQVHRNLLEQQIESLRDAARMLDAEMGAGPSNGRPESLPT